MPRDALFRQSALAHRLWWGTQHGSCSGFLRGSARIFQLDLIDAAKEIELWTPQLRTPVGRASSTTPGSRSTGKG